MKLKCIIVDDEAPAHTIIESHLSTHSDLFQVVQHCFTGMEAYLFLKENEVDVLFLDIEMPQMNGLELLKNIKQKPIVILTTAYSEFALKSYDFEVLDYLLKPITLARFILTIEKITNRLSSQSPIKSVVGTQFLEVRADGMDYQIDIGQIKYIESKGNFIQIHWHKKNLMVLQTMQSIETKLTNSAFCRIHKSYILNLSYVGKLRPKNVLLNDDTCLPIGRKYCGLLEKRYANFLQNN